MSQSKNPGLMIALIALPLLLLALGGAYFLMEGGDEGPSLVGDDETSQRVDKIDPNKKNDHQGSKNKITIEPEKPKHTPKIRQGGSAMAFSGSVSDAEGLLPDAWVFLVDGEDPKTVLAAYRTGDEDSELGLGMYELAPTKVVENAHLMAIADSCTIRVENISEEAGKASQKKSFTLSPSSSFDLKVLSREAKAPIDGADVSFASNVVLDAALTHYFSQFTFDTEAYGLEERQYNEDDPRMPKPLEAMRTNLEGELYLDGLNPGSYAFEVSHVAYKASKKSKAAQVSKNLKEESQVSVEVLLTALPLYSGRVVQGDISNYQPLSAARAMLFDAKGNTLATVRSNEAGNFRFREEYSEARAIRVTAEGYTELTRALSESSPANLGEFILEKAVKLVGWVFDESKRGIGGASVWINEGMMERGMAGIAGLKRTPGKYSTITDSSGRFELRLPKPDPVVEGETPNTPNGGRRGGMAAFMNQGMGLVAAAEGYSDGGIDVPTLNPDGITEVEITLAKAGTILVTVIDDNDMPIAGVTVAAADASNPMVTMGFKSMFGMDEEDNSNPMRGMMRAMMGGQDLEFSAITDASGQYTFAGLPKGGYLVGAKLKGYDPKYESGVQSKPGEEITVTIKLTSLKAILFGIVYDGENKPMGDADINLRKTGDFMSPPIGAKTDAGGRYRIEDITPGKYKFGIGAATGGFGRGGGGAFLEMMNSKGTLELEGGVEREYNYYTKDPNSTTLVGRATLNGDPFVGQLTLGGGGFSGISVKQTRTDENGNFKFEDVKLGTYSISRGGAGGNPMSAMLRQIEVDVREKPEHREDIEFTTITLSGTVRAAAGPLPEDTVVYASPYRGRASSSSSSVMDQVRSQVTEQVTPNEDGTWEINDIEPDTYVVTARSATGGYYRTKPFKATSSKDNIVLLLQPGVGSVHAIVENYVPQSDGGIGAMFAATATLTVEDSTGEVINLGNVSNNPMGGDSAVQLASNDEGKVEFTKEGLPVGTWTVILQASNYGPVRQTVTITEDQTSEVKFVLEPAGDLEIQFLNDDLDPSVAQNIRYTIKDSKGQVYERRFSFQDLMATIMNPQDESKKNTFTLVDFPPDKYTIDMEVPGYKKQSGRFTIKSKEVTELKMTLVEDE